MDIVKTNESQEIPITKIACHLSGVGALSQRATVIKVSFAHLCCYCFP